MPFGQFYSHFVSDSLVLELGETEGVAVIAGYENQYFHIYAGAFNGKLKEEDDADLISDCVAAVVATPFEWLELGTYWMSDIGESGELEESLNASIDSDGTDDVPGVAYKKVSGIGGFIHVASGGWAMEYEYIAAVDEFDMDLLGDSALKPQAWNVELAYAVKENFKLL